MWQGFRRVLFRSLGHKQLQQKPFEKLDPSLTEGDVTNGVVHFINKHGLIVELDCGAVGFVHKSELDWNSAVTLDSFSKGKQVTVMIMTIDREKEKLFFSIKQAQIDPWLEIDRYVSIGQRVKGKVNRILAFGVVVDIYQWDNCLLHRSDMAYHTSVHR